MAVNPDIARERNGATFDPEKLTEVIYGSKSTVRRRRYLQNVVFQDKYLQSFKPWMNRTRQDEYDTGVKKNVYLNKLIKDMDIANGQEMFFLREANTPNEDDPLGLHAAMFIPTLLMQGTEATEHLLEKAIDFKIIGCYAQTELGHGKDDVFTAMCICSILWAAAAHEVLPLGLHMIMFIPTIQRQGTNEQVANFAKKAMNYEILGTYAQTELGHGTFIRGLETTATYDPATEEFIINSPTLTSMKFWPGAMGKTSNYVILMAQLYSQGKCHGIHSFVVQIRSLEDHSPMPGVKVGDIGNKMAYGGMDNGYLMFDNYRVPRDSMLMRYAKIEKDGTYIRPPNAKLTYGSMVFIRALIVGDTARCMAQASTIAVRYSAVRRQTEIRPGGEEPQILDYQTQQEKLFPNLATAYALLFTSNSVLQTYNRITAEVEKGNMEEMQVLHAVAAGLKALSSFAANTGIDQLRLACGGHGYSHASGIPKIWGNITPACTYEGENTVMYLQSARYLVKCAGLVASGQKLPGFMAYLSEQEQRSSPLTEACNLDHLLMAYEHRAARLIKVAASKMQSLMSKGVALEDARNQTSVQLVRAAMAHSQAFVVKTFAEVVMGHNLDESIRKPLTALCKLYAVHGITEKLGEFMQDGYISSSQADMLMNKLLSLFAEIRPNAVALVDAFDYPDGILQSCLGRYDGRVYEALWEYCQNSPLNEKDVMESYYTTLRPLMKGELTANPPPARL